MSKRKKLTDQFKLQVYIPNEIANDIDTVCEARNIFRSQLVREAVEKYLTLASNKKHLEAK